MTGARGYFVDFEQNTRGDVAPFVGKTVTICKDGTSTAISDSLYTSSTAVSSVGQTITISSLGKVEFYWPLAGSVHLPGWVRIYRAASPAIDRRIYVPGPADLPDIHDYYGAMGDGSTNDTPAFTAAFADTGIQGITLRAGHVYTVHTMPTLSADEFTIYSPVPGDEDITPSSGAIIRADAAITAALLVSGARNKLVNVVCDGADLATYGLSVTGDDNRLMSVHAHRGVSHAGHIVGNRTRIFGGFWCQNLETAGTRALYMDGADTKIVGPARARRGEIPFQAAGTGGEYIGVRALGTSNSIADIGVTGARNSVTASEVDTVKVGSPHIWVNASANMFNDMIVIGQTDHGAANTVPVVHLDATGATVAGTVLENFTLIPFGTNWAYFVKETGANAFANHINPKKINGCDAIYDTTHGRPYFIGDVAPIVKIGSGGWDQAAKMTIPLFSPAASTVWSNMPASLTEFLGLTIVRTKLDVAYMTQARLTGRVDTAGLAGSKIYVQYSTDESSWSDLDKAAAAGVGFVLTAQGTITSGWVDIATALFGVQGHFFRVVGSGGDGAADPAFGNLILQFR